MFFKHKFTKQIVEAQPNTPRWEGFNDSPSWVEVYEENTKDSLLSEVPKEITVLLGVLAAVPTRLLGLSPVKTTTEAVSEKPYFLTK